jgi:hypothetical protein
LGISTGTFFNSVGLFIIGKKYINPHIFEPAGDDKGKVVREEMRQENWNVRLKNILEWINCKI